MYQVIVGQNIFNFSNQYPSVQVLIDKVAEKQELCFDDFYLSTRCKPLRAKEQLCLSQSTPLCLDLNIRCLGGKGGFGSLLRGKKTRAGQKKTTNFGACRDLNGRRLWHVEAEKKKQESVQQQEENKKQSKEERIKKTQKNKEEEMKLKGEYINTRSKTLDSVRDAVNNGLKKRKEKNTSSAGASSSKDGQTEEKKRKNQESSSSSNDNSPPKKKRKIMTAMDVLSEDSDSEEDDDTSDLDDVIPTISKSTRKDSASTSVKNKKPSVTVH